MSRKVTARWTGGLSSTVELAGTHLAIGDDAPAVDGIPAALPTEVLLASVASCFAMAMAWVATKRDAELPGLEVDVSGDYDGPRISALDICVRADAYPDLLEYLLPRAERVCWVTNTLRQSPQITIRLAT
jgi:putative redox protein